MPAGIQRAKFIPVLAKTLKLRPQALRDRLNKAGHDAPYDEAKSLTIVEGLGYKTDKYRAKMMKGAAPAASTPAKPNGKHKPNGHDKSTARGGPGIRGGKVPPEVIAKRNATLAKKMIPRLAALLPGGITDYNKMKVRRILAKHGWTTRPYDDELRAIAIFKEEGIDVRKFEYKTASAKDAPAIAPTAPTAPTITRIEDHPDYWLIAAAKHARINLEQMEESMFVMRDAGQISRIGKPWDMAFNALNLLRYPPPKRQK